MPFLLETESLRLSFHETTGALIHLESKKTGWVIHRREELGLSWRMLIPVNEEMRNNPVYGEQQILSRVLQKEKEITFVWEKIQSQAGGTAGYYRYHHDSCGRASGRVVYPGGKP